LNINIEIDRDAIHIYCCRYDRIDEPQLLDQYHSLLNQAERQRWQGIRTEEGKLCFLVSRAMMRTLLGAAISCPPTALTVTADAQGKPFIDRSTTHWQFTLSHSRGLITLALAYDTAIGIDVECYHRNTETLQLARHFFHSQEIQQLEALPADEQRQHFFKLWTLKEAYVKAIGCGLSHALDSVGFTFHQPDSKLAMHPPPQSTVNCWLAQPESGYTLASIALSQSSEVRSLKLNDYLPHRHCTPRQLDSQIHSVISPTSAHPY
jgi:4'-phosphopantetheinyl transferase